MLAGRHVSVCLDRNDAVANRGDDHSQRANATELSKTVWYYTTAWEGHIINRAACSCSRVTMNMIDEIYEWMVSRLPFNYASFRKLFAGRRG